MSNLKTTVSDFLKTHNEIKGVIFDFDGTIVDLRVDYSALRLKLQNFSSQEFGFENDFLIINNSLSMLKNKHGNVAFEKASLIIQTEEIEQAAQVQVDETTVSFLSKLSSTKRLFLFSMNSREAIDLVLKNSRLSSVFEFIISKEDIKNSKPHPEGVYAILRYSEIPVDKMVYVGDRDIDIMAGRAAGVKTLLVS